MSNKRHDARRQAGDLDNEIVVPVLDTTAEFPPPSHQGAPSNLRQLVMPHLTRIRCTHRWAVEHGARTLREGSP